MLKNISDAVIFIINHISHLFLDHKLKPKYAVTVHKFDLAQNNEDLSVVGTPNVCYKETSTVIIA